MQSLSLIGVFCCIAALLFVPNSCSAAVTAKLSVDPNEFAIGTNHTATCTVGGFDPSTTLAYSVSFLFDSNTAGLDRMALGVWGAALGMNPTFTPALENITEANGLVVAGAPDYLVKFPDFWITFAPQSDKARGKYQCVLTVHSDLSGNPQTADSNLWNASFGVVTPSIVTLVALAMVVLWMSTAKLD